MKKIFLTFIAALTLNASLVDGIALIVNKKPITLYEIDKLMEKDGVSKEVAISNIIDKIIYTQQLKKYNIDISLLDIDNYLEKLASSNNMNLLDFKMIIRQQQDYNDFIKKLKQQLTHQALVKKISQGNLKVVSDDDMKIYYENHKEQYTMSDSIDVIAYTSKNRALLERLQTNPMLNISGISSKSITFKQEELNPQVKYILNNTAVNSFSTIFTQAGQYNMFFIKNKTDVKTLPFESVKNQIFNTMMKKREQSYLQNYFETLKITADVQVLR